MARELDQIRLISNLLQSAELRTSDRERSELRAQQRNSERDEPTNSTGSSDYLSCYLSLKVPTLARFDVACLLAASAALGCSDLAVSAAATYESHVSGAG